MSAFGNRIDIDHGHGLSTRYGRLSEILVAEGQQLAQGDPIGRLGSTGRSTGPHLHYEARVDGEPSGTVYPRRGGDGGGGIGACPSNAKF
jgi:murein DD-endopeptidase MepM/ murein hydrolase activator NlpD